MNFFAGFSLPSQAILENVGQEARLKDAEKGAESAGLKYWDRLICSSHPLQLPYYSSRYRIRDNPYNLILRYIYISISAIFQLRKISLNKFINIVK
jgi:hypothetical protein